MIKFQILDNRLYKPSTNQSIELLVTLRAFLFITACSSIIDKHLLTTTYTEATKYLISCHQADAYD